MEEIDDWCPVKGFPGYSVNPLGHVRKDATKRVLEPRFNQYGVPYVGLMRNWGQYIRSLPRIVANAFLPPPTRHFDTPIQIDGDRSNCRADNLMWRPRWYAVKYNRQFKNRYPHPIKTPIKVVGGNETFANSLDAARRFGLLESEVVMSVLNRTPVWPTYQYFELAEMS